MNTEINIITLPVFRWQEYKALRLEALQKESHAFMTTYDEAIAKPDEEWIERIISAEKKDKDILLFAEVNGKLAGMIGAYFNKKKEQQGIVTIWGVYVTDHYRGRGVGKKLLEEILSELKVIPDIKSIKLMVNQEQTPATGLYQQLGFTVIGTERIALGDGKEHDEFVMEKII